MLSPQRSVLCVPLVVIRGVRRCVVAEVYALRVTSTSWRASPVRLLCAVLCVVEVFQPCKSPVAWSSQDLVPVASETRETLALAFSNRFPPQTHFTCTWHTYTAHSPEHKTTGVERRAPRSPRGTSATRHAATRRGIVVRTYATQLLAAATHDEKNIYISSSCVAHLINPSRPGARALSSFPSLPASSHRPASSHPSSRVLARLRVPPRRCLSGRAGRSG